jgi:hypothetical protein
VASSSVSTGQNPLTSASYNLSGQPTNLQFGSGDADTLSYDFNMGRMTSYQFTINGSSEVVALTWNANGTLGTPANTDPFTSSNQHTCTYGYDDPAVDPNRP